MHQWARQANTVSRAKRIIYQVEQSNASLSTTFVVSSLRENEVKCEWSESEVVRRTDIACPVLLQSKNCQMFLKNTTYICLAI